MKYPLIIHHEEGSAYGITVPDISGCFSAGDTLDEAYENVKEAIDAHLELLVEDGEKVPTAKSLEAYREVCLSEGAILGLVEIDVLPYLGKADKINITLPVLLIKKIDRTVAEHPAYKSRSNFLAESALRELALLG